MKRQPYFTIAPHAPFLPTLAARVLRGDLVRLGDGPLALADLTIFVPTNRARTALAEAFLAEAGTGATLLPDIRALGEEDETAAPFLPPYDTAPLPPVIAPAERRLVLARLVAKWIETQEHEPFSSWGLSGFASPPSPAEILALADSLAGLIDDFTIEGVTPQKLRQLPVDDRSGHWQEALDFLQIVIRAWPDILGDRGVIDTADARNRLLLRQAEAAAQIFADRPVIAAGSTGSIPATAGLMAAIARLPNGALVFPGVDTAVSGQEHEALLDPANNPHGHPQYGLLRLLRRLDTTPGAVTELADPETHSRTLMVRRALAPAEATGRWAENRLNDAAEATRGLSLLVAPNQEIEARAVAIAARAELDTPNRRVGIVTPDRNLARRIAAELKRFDIHVDDGAGTPLFQSRAGRLARAAIAVARDDCAPVGLIALLRNRYVGLGLPRAEIVRLTDLIELALLRGQRPSPGLAGLKKAIHAHRQGPVRGARHRLTGDEADALDDLVDRLDIALDPLFGLAERPTDAAGLAEALVTALDALIAGDDQPAVPPGLDLLHLWRDSLSGLEGEGPEIGLAHAADALRHLLTGLVWRDPQPGRPDIVIWGLLEARLQTVDLMILAGLNETVWPAVADPGPWLSRGMAIGVGLEPPERRQGQMAHDFEMALGNPEVLIALSERIGTAPADPSRFVQRLEASLGADAAILRQRGEKWRALAGAIDFAGPPQSARRPAPNPPLATRPDRLSITEIETLIRSPYDIYARHVLRLKPLGPLGEDPDARERGTLVHQVLAEFVRAHPDPTAPDAFDAFMAIADTVFAALETNRERRAVWRKRLEAQAERYLAFEAVRAADIGTRHAEIDGTWTFPAQGGDFTLTGRADRLDLRHDGRLDIFDFKTGGIPAPRDMQALLAPQLLLEALIAHQGGFKGLPPAEAADIAYIKLAQGPEAFARTPVALPEGQDMAATLAEVQRRLVGHVGHYLRHQTPLPPLVVPSARTYPGDYDHLARLAEWSVAGDEDEQ